MGSNLHLILLSLCVAMIKGKGFTVNQPDRLEAVEGGSIEIPCTFTYPDSYRPPRINIFWRRSEFHGEFIFNLSRGYTHPIYRGRIDFLGSPDTGRTGTIRIKKLGLRDTNRYFCRVAITGNKSEAWQSIPGTRLTVRARQPTTSNPTVKTSTISTTTLTTNRRKLAWILGIAVATVIVLLISVAIAVTFYVRKKKDQQRGNFRKGSVHNGLALDSSPAKDEGLSQEGPGTQYRADTESTGEFVHPEGIVYASLQAGRGGQGPTTRSKAPRGEGDILYAAVRFQSQSS
ncbi:paired immunoglobulin-like type 2 receptor beta-2 isoform X1 [Stegostoma tigrinum]|uniref:paired immunoglobulin-like type 2 receptor beta-2 isoform X1 n=1 Tax=Stegostoma tigrinum TaxID=3053191 RepID=UPI00286FFC29|nr:paired immunoglobulin-like type 2 receptor beta-2 isoform X1 [Stegostoma tigrinum]